MRFLAVPVVALFACALLPVRAQEALNLVVVGGEGAINNVRQRTAREPIVRVEDQNHKPVAGAVVAFTLPTQGASGSFTGGVQTLTVMTNSRGLAIAKGFHPNNIGGQFQMHINASFGSQTATTAITQTNLAAATAAGAGAAGAGTATGVAVGVSAKVIAIVAVAAGAAAAGGAVVAAKAGGGDSKSPTPTTISTGSGTVGAPR